MHHPSRLFVQSGTTCPEDDRSDGSRDVMPRSHLAGGDGCLRAGEADTPHKKQIAGYTSSESGKHTTMNELSKLTRQHYKKNEAGASLGLESH
jgi:hypothetical protein